MRTHWVMDYETLSNCFIAVFEDIKSEQREIFVVHESQNDILELVEFLQGNIAREEWHVSFNGLGFDSQITEYILRNRDTVIHNTGDTIAKWLYGKAQDIIERQNRGEFLEFSPRDLQINQVDVFKLNHWDNNAKRSSLKWIQYTMDWHNIMDMPIHHTSKITAEQIPEVIRYCIKRWDLRQMRTHRSMIKVDEIILPYIEFKTATFQNLLKKFKEVVIFPGQTKGGFKYSVQYKGVKTDYGLGGIHGARRSKVYKSDEDMVIMTSDVTSFYPNLAIRNKWAPAHLPQDEFCSLYEWFFEERKKIPKSDPKNYVYKIILNSTYGLSNDENSFLYDPEFTMRITINGQLSLSMLYEMICEEIPNAIPLMQNTDGLETMIPRQYVDKYMEICKRWEEMTNLQLEHDTYSKIVLGDVNNYIAVTEDGKSKCKGRFEYKDLAMHKNKSFLIIPKALHAYFVDGIDPEDFMKANTDIFDYCGGVKIKGDWSFHFHKVHQGEYQDIPLQHTIRYYISNSGGKIVKKNNEDMRAIQVEAGKWMQTLMIDYEKKEFEDYDINLKYYLEKVRKEIENLEPSTNQLSLF